MRVGTIAVVVGCIVGGALANPGCTTKDDPAADANVSQQDGALPDAAPTDAGADAAVTDSGADAGVTNPPAVLTTLGSDPSKILLQGMVVTPTQSFTGEVLVETDLITCVAASCAGEPGAATASVVQTNGIILPGLIDTNTHGQLRIFDGTDWTPSQQYSNHEQWPNEPRYGALVDAKQYLNGEGGSPMNVGCELNKYGEIQALVAGTTSVVSKSNPPNRACYRTLARTIDQSANGLCAASPSQSCADYVQTATLLPSTSTADAVCDNFTNGDTHAYFVQVAEGVDPNALDELNDLYLVSTVDGCLFNPATTVVHGTALGSAELTQMATNGMGLSWSPKSNVVLYGGGTDLAMTTDIPLALAAGLTVSLSTGLPMAGSSSILEEMRFADTVDNAQWGDILTPQMLLEMVTVNAAEQLALETSIGRLEVGWKADILVVGGDVTAPYDAILAATAREVRLVMVDGVSLYGSSQLQPLGPATPGCETLTLCGESKYICVAISGQPASTLLDQTLVDIETGLSTASQDYDNLNLSQWDFSPIAPLAVCP